MPLYKNKGNIQQLQEYQTTKSHYESLEHGGRDEDDEEYVYFRELIRIYVRAIKYVSYSYFKEIVGAVQG